MNFINKKYLIKKIWSKHKRMLSIILAMVFLVALFLLKNGLLFTLFKSNTTYQAKNQASLAYGNMTIGDLVNKSTTGDGIPDWEKILWGLDPTKKENVPGVPDSVTIEKLKAQQLAENGGQTNTSAGNQNTGNTTQTDEFSKDLFATVAAATENGQSLDQATIDKISSSLADNIKNSPPRKIYTLADIKIINDDTIAAAQKYSNTLNGLYQKTPVKYTVMDVLQKFAPDENTEDASALSQLDPIIKQINNFLNGMLGMSAPQSLATLHLGMINGLEKVMENLNDIKLYDTDVVVALSAISQYQTNAATLEATSQILADAIKQKLKPR
jgi:hypothetical protein